MTTKGLVILSIIALFTIVLISATVNGQEGSGIPQWIKNSVTWWSEGKVSDSEFINAMQYLIEQNIIKIKNTSQHTTDSVVLPSVTTDKRTYIVGEKITISGTGFENGTVGLLVGDDRFSIFLDKSQNIFTGTQASKLGDMIKYPIPDPSIQEGQWKQLNFSAYGSVLKTNVQSDMQGMWQIALKNSNLTAGHYEVRVGQNIYNGYDILSNSSQTFLLKTAKTDFFIG